MLIESELKLAREQGARQKNRETEGHRAEVGASGLRCTQRRKPNARSHADFAHINGLPFFWRRSWSRTG